MGMCICGGIVDICHAHFVGGRAFETLCSINISERERLVELRKIYKGKAGKYPKSLSSSLCENTNYTPRYLWVNEILESANCI